MKQECADGIRIAKIHPQSHAWIYQHVVLVIRNIHGIAEKRLIRWPSQIIEQQEMQLMNVERVQFVRPVLDDPIFYRSLLRDDVRQARFRGSNSAGVWPSTVM